MNGEKPKKGLAITSLVLGILSIGCLFFVAGIPAIITGAIARKRAGQSPEQYGGAGLALAGLILGCVGTVLTVVALVAAGLMLPALAKAKERAQSIMCVNNLKQIGLAVRIYASDHNEKFPNGFGQLPNGPGPTGFLICPADPNRTQAGAPEAGGAPYSSYEWVLAPGAADDNNPGKVVARCPVHGNVVMSDGSVQQGRGRR
jgi:hypothetical protein